MKYRSPRWDDGGNHGHPVLILGAKKRAGHFGNVDGDCFPKFGRSTLEPRLDAFLSHLRMHNKSRWSTVLGISVDPKMPSIETRALRPGAKTGSAGPVLKANDC